MGITALWQLLKDDQVVEHYRGAAPHDYAVTVAAVDDKAIAIDLSMWIMQADQQVALLPHFSKEERCMKVAFERAVQWLRHGCLPVVVVEGRPPQEKQAAQRARFAARNGYAGGGSKAGASQFQRLGETVGKLLEELGLPVFYAPGEAEALCAALNRAGCVDGCASFDSDTLLYGAETVYRTLKLSTMLPRDCELSRVSMESIRRRLGLQRGGAKALGVVAMMSGSDYDPDGAQGVGSVGGFAMARHLLQGDADDSAVLERLAALVQRPTNQQLLDLNKCTGCLSCGHEGGCKGKIKRHSSRNNCPCCPASQDGICCSTHFEKCQCAFHRLEAERKVERMMERVRKMPSFLADAQAAIGVFERQGAEADVYVRQRLAQLGLAPGHRLHWLHRPSVQGVFAAIEAKRRLLTWDLPAIRSKLLPVLLEWDMQQAGGDGDGGGSQVEFRAVEIQKVHGQKGKADPLTASQWRYVVKWERGEGEAEELGPLQVRAKKPRAKPGSAAAGDAGDGEGFDAEGGNDASKTSQQVPGGGGGGGGGLFGGGGEEQDEVMTLREFDLRWLKEQPAEHRAVRISALRRLLPHLEQQYQQRQLGGGGGSSSGGKQGGGAAAGGSGGGAGGRGGGRKARVGSAKAAAAKKLLLLDEDDEQQQQQRDGDLTQYLVQKRAGEQPTAAPAAASTAAASKGKQLAAAVGYGLAGSSAAPPRLPAAASGQQHLPASEASMRALLSRALGPAKPAAAAAEQQQQAQLQRQRQQQHHPPPQQQASPEKKQRSPPAAAPPRAAAAAARAAAAAAAAGRPGSPEFEALLSSPESPRLLPSAAAAAGQLHGQPDVQQQQHGGGGSSSGGGSEADAAMDGGHGDSSSPLPLAERWLRVARAMQQQAASDLADQQQTQQRQEDADHQPLPQQQQQQRQALSLQERSRASIGQQQQPGRRSSGGGGGVVGSAGRNIRRYFASPPSAAAPAAAAAAAAAGEFVDLVTPPRPLLPNHAVPAALPAAGGGGMQLSLHRRQQRSQPQLTDEQQQPDRRQADGQQVERQQQAAVVPGSPIDLTQDSD